MKITSIIYAFKIMFPIENGIYYGKYGLLKMVTLMIRVQRLPIFLFIRFTCLSVQTLVFTNNLRMSSNCCIVFKSSMTYFVLKMMHIKLMIHLQRVTKELRHITVNR